MIGSAVLVGAPPGPDLDRVQQALLPQPSFVQQVLGPVAERAPKPGADRDVETVLRPFEQVVGKVAAQHLAQQPLTLTVPNFERGRHAPGELHDATVEERAPCLQPDRHARPVELHEHVARQIAGHVAIHEPVGGAGQRRYGAHGGRAGTERHRSLAQRDQPLIELTLIPGPEHAHKLLHPLATHRAAQPGRHPQRPQQAIPHIGAEPIQRTGAPRA